MRLWMELILNNTREADKIRAHTHRTWQILYVNNLQKKKIQRKVVEFHKIVATLPIIPAGLCSE